MLNGSNRLDLDQEVRTVQFRHLDQRHRARPGRRSEFGRIDAGDHSDISSFVALRGGGVRSKLSASSAERLSADDTIRMRLPMTSIKRLNASGAPACAIRAGAPMIPRR